MTPPSALAKLGIAPVTDFKKYALVIQKPLPEALQNKTYLANLAKGLTTTGSVRKRRSHYHPRKRDWRFMTSPA